MNATTLAGESIHSSINTNKPSERNFATQGQPRMKPSKAKEMNKTGNTFYKPTSFITGVPEDELNQSTQRESVQKSRRI